MTIDNPSEMCYNESAVSEADSLKGEKPMRLSKICVLYERLSREDDDVQGQSNSIMAAKRVRLKEYHRQWYQDNKERMKAEKAEKRSQQINTRRADKYSYPESVSRNDDVQLLL